MKILVTDRRAFKNANWWKISDLLRNKQLVSFDPDSEADMKNVGEVAGLHNYALDHPLDKIRVITSIEGRVACAMLPTNVEVVVWNAKPLTKITWSDFIMTCVCWPSKLRKEFLNTGLGFNGFLKIYSGGGAKAQSDYETVYEAYSLDAQMKQEGLSLLTYNHRSKPNKAYSTQDDLTSLQLAEIVEVAKENPQFGVAFDTETTGLDPLNDKLVGISISFEDDQAIWIPSKFGTAPYYASMLLEMYEVPKYAHNGKFDIRVLRNAGVEVHNLSQDTLIMAYMLGRPKLGLKALAVVELGESVVSFQSIVDTKKGETFADLTLEKQIPYACQDADLTRQLTIKFRTELAGNYKLRNLYTNVEMPLMTVLSRMEDAGAPVNQQSVEALIKSTEKGLQIAEELMEKEAGEPFNPNSPNEVSSILFTKLGLDPIKSTATGLSTDKHVLKQLADQHPVVGHIIEWKKLSKMLQTYLRPLKASGATRIHANFNQTVTATGRLSSSNPNLQNQPPEIRKVYKAEPGCKLVAADYGQQELRLLAHFSQEPKWLDAFKTGHDLHDATAELFNIPRKIAKNVNFGIPYGAGPAVIAQQAGCSLEEATKVLRDHKRGYPILWDWIEETKNEARKRGWAESMSGRVRLLPNIDSNFPDLRAAAEREAVNMVIQGTAADMTKIAMNYLSKLSDEFKIIMQVHDEIIFTMWETDSAIETANLDNIKSTMESVYSTSLTVPMVANVMVGDTWADLKS